MLVLVLISLSMSALAHTVFAGEKKLPTKALVYGISPPPIGFVRFCERFTDECKATSGRVSNFSLSRKDWTMVTTVNNHVNNHVQPMNDIDLYGTDEWWTYPEKYGDCEDYVLAKKAILVRLGIPRQVLRITTVLDERGEGHAVLTVVTKDADYVLDNRRAEVRVWSDAEYTFRTRESANDPTTWEVLGQESNTAVATGN